MRGTFVLTAVSWLKWPLALAALAGLLAVAYRIHQGAEERRAAEAAEAAEPPRRAANKVIKLGARLAESLGLKDEPARPASWAPRLPAYGRVVPNPRVTSEVRVTFAGILRPPPGGWPTLGSRVTAGQELGILDVRVGPQERLDLVTKLAEARLKQAGADKHVQLCRERLERFQSAGSSVSRAEIDMARTQLTESRTQLETARAAVKEWQRALDSIEGRAGGKAAWSRPLTAPAAGEITELPVRPGMAVEPGALIARVIDFRFVLVRLELPPEALPAGPPQEVELVAAAAIPPALAGANNRPEPAAPAPYFPARLVGAAPQVEVASQYAAYWYEVDTAASNGAIWRPGLFVKGFVKAPGVAPRPGVSVPGTALLYHDGRALVYVRLNPGRYERREVRVLGRDGGRWVLAEGVEAGEPVVSQRAQVLLSEEFRGDADND
jgi:multidrug efflux pump subunit AcrA (membrane-fusion protein)